MSSTRLLPIGEVAETTGIAVSALRYYEEIGVISSAARVGGKRRFDPATIGRVTFIQRAQEVGFSLEEIGTILDDEKDSWRVLVDDKLIELTERKHRLETMISMLAELRECGCGAVSTCPRVTTS